MPPSIDRTHGVELRAYELARLTISGNPPAPRPAAASAILAPGATLEKLAGGFHDITGAAVDARGDLFFVDTRRQTIYQWSNARRALAIVRDSPLDPAQLGFDEDGEPARRLVRRQGQRLRVPARQQRERAAAARAAAGVRPGAGGRRSCR